MIPPTHVGGLSADTLPTHMSNRFFLLHHYLYGKLTDWIVEQSFGCRWDHKVQDFPAQHTDLANLLPQVLFFYYNLNNSCCPADNLYLSRRFKDHKPVCY